MIYPHERREKVVMSDGFLLAINMLKPVPNCKLKKSSAFDRHLSAFVFIRRGGINKSFKITNIDKNLKVIKK